MLLSQILPEVARLHPNNYALKSKDEVLTYAEVYEMVSRVAYGFKELGIKPSDRIALLGNPSSKLAIAEYAAVAIGAIPFAVFPSLTTIEIESIIEDATPVAIVYGEDSSLIGYTSSCSSVKLFLISCKSDEVTASIESFIADKPPLLQWHEADPDDIALLIYTGGTTGRSKGVMHTHRNIKKWSRMNPEDGIGRSPQQKNIVYNLAHLTGQYTLWFSITIGGCLIFLDSYPVNPEEVVTLIEREQLTSVGTVGALLRDIVNLDNIQQRQLQSVKAIFCGGSPISLSTIQRTVEVFPGADLFEVYSQTESGNFISYLPVSQCIRDGKLERLLSVGNPDNMASWGQQKLDVRIVDELGKDVPQGNAGEVICRGDQIMVGYWNNPDETNRTIKDGWLRTGDIGWMDEDGCLYLVDRKKDIVIVNGANVYCTEVEEVLGRHPHILDVAVISTPAPDEGEEVTAVLTLRSSKYVTLEELQRYCMDRIATFKIPTRLEIMEILPRTSVGKLNKAKLREQYWVGKNRNIH